jgi:hypothetical protein
MLLEPQRRAVERSGKEKGEAESFRLLNGDGGCIGSVDVYEISQNRFRRAKCFPTTEVHRT